MAASSGGAAAQAAGSDAAIDGGKLGSDDADEDDADAGSDVVYVPVPGAPGGFSVPYDPDALPEAPFTLQRLSEVLLDPDVFGNAHKLMNSLEKVRVRAPCLVRWLVLQRALFLLTALRVARSSLAPICCV